MDKLNLILLISCLCVEIFDFISNWITYSKLKKFERKYDVDNLFKL